MIYEISGGCCEEVSGSGLFRRCIGWIQGRSKLQLNMQIFCFKKLELVEVNGHIEHDFINSDDKLHGRLENWINSLLMKIN